ncbi:MarR family winged helix-turn-helix transcriptional regulator [Mycobacteroides immunogenum]|uniref:MarR family winged helix-turn-helix transcriptional regulator n=1 Tax=Mycobacteroides immunogenum TaxID=83262 RepID=UPI000B1A4E67|nr:MarR family winged helix-turn-helix transcriptional regulator [Mycobacteroides immunogenum]
MTDPPAAAHDFPVSFAVFALARIHRAAAGMLSDIGLHLGQEIMLIQLNAAVGRSQKSLRELLRADHSTVAKSVARLQKAGLVTRSKADYDERVSLVTLTPAGAELREKALAAWAGLEDITVSRLTEPEQRQFVALAGKLVSHTDEKT